MLTIFDEGWKVGLSRLTFVPFESPRPRVPGIGFLTSVPNRVWNVMGSPCLTFLASNISSGGPSYFYHLKLMHIRLSGRSLQMFFKTSRASGDMVSLLVHPSELGGFPHSLGR